MPTPENPYSWSALTRRGKRNLQFRPESASPALRQRGLKIRSSIHIKDYEGSNPILPISIVHTVYRGGSSAVKYLNSVDRELTRIDRMEEKGQKGNFKVVYHEDPSVPRDYFTRKYGGVSLDDLARLPNQLSREDLGKIFDFWIYLGLNSSFKRKERSKAVAINNLAGSFALGLDNGSRPNFRIQRIQASLAASLRFYREHLLNFSSEEDVDLLVKSFSNHMHTLALIYSFETSGLSLSSIQKLFMQRGQQLAATGKIPLYRKLFFRAYNKITNLGIADIKKYRPLNSPWGYLFYQPEIDKPIEKVLESNYDLANLAEDGLEESYEKTKQLISEWRQYHLRLANRLIASPVNIEINEHPFISSIRLTARTKESTHFILFFADSNLYLTLDIDSAGRLFGLPPNLAVRFPHADLAIFGDVLSTLIPKLEKIFPDTAQAIRKKQERKDDRTIIKLQETQIFPLEAQPRSPVTQTKRESATTPSKPPKRKALQRESYIEESQFSPELESEVSQAHPARIVEYSADLILDLVGKRTDERYVTQVMNAIRRFEFGLGDIEYMERESEFGPGVLRLKSKKFRILFKHRGQNAYEIIRIGKRDDHGYVQ